MSKNNDNILTGIRTRLTQSREDLTKYENLWKDYDRRELTFFTNDVQITFEEVIFNLEKLLWEVEALCISHESLKGEVDILFKYLYRSPHILNNQTLKNELDNELRNLKEKNITQIESFMKYLK
jgi:hypothetical protein